MVKMKYSNIFITLENDKNKFLTLGLSQPLVCFILCVTGVLPACMSIYHLQAWCPQKPEESVGSADGYVTLDGCWELNLRISGRTASALNC